MEQPVKKPKDPLRYSVWLLERKARSEGELRQALARKGVTAAEIEEIVVRLYDWGYLDDQRYKEQLIRSRQRHNVKGRQYVRQELYRAGITDLDDLDDLYDDEMERAAIEKLLSQWAKSSKPPTREQSLRRLASRGFAAHNVFTVLSEEE